MPVFNNALAGASGQGSGGGGYVIEKSLRFTPGDSAYLSRSATDSGGNVYKYTVSWWMKIGGINADRTIISFATNNAVNGWTKIHLRTDNRLSIYGDSSGTALSIRPTMLFRDPTAWYHCVVSLDTTQSTYSDQAKFYINGVQQTDFTGTLAFAQNTALSIGEATTHHVGVEPNSVGTLRNYFDGYIADLHVIEGQVKDVTDFGAFDDNNVWQAKEYTGSHGTNGFHLDFADGTNDAAGSNNWTAHNLITAPYEASTSDVTVFKQGAVDPGVSKIAMFDGNKASFTYAAGATATNYIEWAPSGGYTTPGYIWIQGGDGGGGGVQNMTVSINGTTVTRTTVVDNETYSSTAYDWGDWSKFTVSGNTLNTLRLTGANALIRGLSTVADPTHSVLGISDDNNVPTIRAGEPEDLDIYVDSPTNGDTDDDTGAGGEVSGNYATYNPLHNNAASGGNGAILSDGNLETTFTTSSSTGTVPATIFVSSGKWYCEFTAEDISSSAEPQIGIVGPEDAIDGYIGKPGSNGVGYEPFRDRRYNAGTSTTSIFGQTTTSGTHTYGLALDLDDGTLDIYEDGTLLGELVSGLSGTWTFAAGDIGGSDTPVIIANFGQRKFQSAAPSGFKCLCTTNLPDPTIADGSDYFDAVLYSGTGNAQSITGLEFSPDLVWTKNRGASASHAVYDSVRGAGELIRTNETSAEVTVSSRFTSFDSNGFSIGGTSTENNASSNTYVSWAWDAGSSNTTISAGSLNSSVYDQSQTWSTLDTWPSASYSTDPDHVFNGVYGTQNTSDFWYSSGASTVDLSNLATALGTGVTNITIWIFDRSGDVTLTVNSASATESQDNAYQEISIDHDGSAITTFTIQGTDSSYWGIGGIKVNGRLLVDSGVSVSNVPTIASTYRANPSAGFSIVSYTGSSSAVTVGHGLNATPKMIIVKDRDFGYNWQVNHASIGADESLILNGTNPATDYNAWNNTRPTSSVFSLGAGTLGVNTNGNDLIAYCFAPVAGYSAFGSYTGNGDANGPFVYTGFRPRFILLKDTDTTAYMWNIYDSERDTYNVSDTPLEPDSNASETGTTYPGAVDFLSNGFKIRSSHSTSYINTSGNAVIYAAFAENPFQANGGLAR